MPAAGLRPSPTWRRVCRGLVRVIAMLHLERIGDDGPGAEALAREMFYRGNELALGEFRIMAIPISLKHATDEIDGFGSAMDGWIDRRTGEFVFIPREENYGTLDEEMQADVDRVKASEDFIAIPSRFDFHEYRHMEHFCLSLPDDRVRERLLDAINGKGAFRRFKDTALRLGVRDAWFEYRLKQLAEQVADFLEVNKIPCVDDVGLPERPKVHDLADDD